MEHGVNMPLELWGTTALGGWEMPVPRCEGQGVLRGHLPTWPL